MKNKILIKGFVGLDYDENIVISRDNDNFNYETPLADEIHDKIIENDEELELSVDGEPDEEMGGVSYYIPNCEIYFYISDNPISLEEVSEKYIIQLLGGLNVFAENYGYSAWTIMGYDVSRFTIGNHDLTQILKGYVGKYINFVMEY